MEYTEYVRRPFLIEAVEVTADNIAEIAHLVGELKVEGDKPYILVNRNVVPNVVKVFPGYFMTRMGNNIRCYSPKIFSQQFSATSPSILEWVNWMNRPESPAENETPQPAEPEGEPDTQDDTYEAAPETELVREP